MYVTPLGLWILRLTRQAVENVLVSQEDALKAGLRPEMAHLNPEYGAEYPVHVEAIHGIHCLVSDTASLCVHHAGILSSCRTTYAGHYTGITNITATLVLGDTTSLIAV